MRIFTSVMFEGLFPPQTSCKAKAPNLNATSDSIWDLGYAPRWQLAAAQTQRPRSDYDDAMTTTPPGGYIFLKKSRRPLSPSERRRIS